MFDFLLDITQLYVVRLNKLPVFVTIHSDNL